MKHAMRLKAITHNQVAGSVGTRAPRRQICFRPEQVTALINHALQTGHGGIALAIDLGWWLAQRPSDILTIRWEDYNPVDRSFIITQRKTGRVVRCYLPASSLVAQAHKEGRHGAIVTPAGMDGASAYDERSFRREFEAVKNSLFGLCNLQFRDLRRSAAVHGAEMGANEIQLAALGGWDINHSREILESYVPRTGAMALATLHLRAKE